MYQEPKINVLLFGTEDIVRTSDGEMPSCSEDDNVDDNGWT